MTRAVALLCLSGTLAAAASPDPKSLDVPADAAARAAELVKQLADRDYEDRAEATNELRKLGRLALPALKLALATDTNPEVRLRVELLLPAAASADLRAKIDCFLADKDGKFQHDLPAAKTFFAAAGRTDAAKQMFAEMMRSANRDVLLAVDGPEGDLQQKYAARRAEAGFPLNGNVVINPQNPTAANALDLAALLFAESKLPDRGTAGVGVGARSLPLISNYNFQTALIAALNGDRKEPLAAVLRHWMDTRDQPLSVYYAVSAMNRANLPHALPAARRLAADKGANAPGIYRSNAIAYLARYGSLETDLPVLEKLFDDKGVATNVFVGGVGAKRHVIQNRDVALAMALLLTKQTPADYGITYRYANNGASDTLKYNYSAYHFEADTEEKADEKREAAFKKFAEWKEKQKKEKK